MVKQEYIDKLFGIPRHFVSSLYFLEDQGDRELVVQLARHSGTRFQCPCGRLCDRYYDFHERMVRDLAFGAFSISWLVFYQFRVDCPDCGVKTEALDWVEPRVRYTKRLAGAVALACREIRSLSSVGKQFDLSWKTVKEIDKKALLEELPPVGETDATILAVDEFAIKKRHKYGTTVIDAKKAEVLYVGWGRHEGTLASFYEAMGSDRCDQVEAVAMDMWQPFEKATRAHCQHARIVYDPFHIIRNYGSQVVDRVRIDEAAKASEMGKKLFRGSKYLLLKNSENLSEEKDEAARLKELLDLNRKLTTVYVLKDDLKQLWSYKREYWARRFFEQWYKRAIYSKIEPLKKFARSLKGNLDGILAHCKYPIHTGTLEGINNKIKVIKRVAFGFGDMTYFFLKIRSSFRRSTL